MIDIDTLLSTVSVAALAKTLPAFIFMATGAVGGADEGYKINRSLRFRAASSAYLSRTPASAGNRTTWTFSTWMKRGRLGALQTIFEQYVNTNNDLSFISFDTTDRLNVGNFVSATWKTRRISTAVFRDTSAWYHVVVSQNGATGCNIYVNGVQLTAFDTSIGPDASNWYFNSAATHYIGGEGPSSNFFDGYLADVYFIDGQALDASAFGQIDPNTGVWSPKKYTGSFGTNGFYLDFSNNSAATAAAIGADRSGNGNNWSPSGISVSLGISNDSFVDVPTNWGTDASAANLANARGNYPTYSPLAQNRATISNGNLYCTLLTGQGTNAQSFAFTTAVIPSSGRYYFEFTSGSSNTFYNSSAGVVSVVRTAADYLAIAKNYNTASGADQTFTSIDANSTTYGFAVDTINGTITATKSGAAYATSSIPAGDLMVFMACSDERVLAGSFNFGQCPFTYDPPGGFKTLCTQNFPAPVIVKPSQYFNVVLDTGANIKSSAESLFAGSDFMEWIKDRANSNNHQLIDTIRGTSAVLQSNTTNAETTYSAPSGNSVAWVWKEGALPGFDILTFNKTSGVNESFNHSLGVAPKLVIVKARPVAASSWWLWHSALSGTEYLKLNTTDAKGTDATAWNSSVPNSSRIFMGTGWNSTSVLAYVFAEVPGFSRFGSYTGNGNADGPFVWCGFRPRFVMFKRTDAAGAWHILDSRRNPSNVAGFDIGANTNAAEGSGYATDLLSNGFKVRVTAGDENASGGTYIFIAFAETPFKFALAN